MAAGAAVTRVGAEVGLAAVGLDGVAVAAAGEAHRNGANAGLTRPPAPADVAAGRLAAVRGDPITVSEAAEAGRDPADAVSARGRGVGQVYRATDLQTGRSVAVKSSAATPPPSPSASAPRPAPSQSWRAPPW